MASRQGGDVTPRRSWASWALAACARVRSWLDSWALARHDHHRYQGACCPQPDGEVADESSRVGGQRDCWGWSRRRVRRSGSRCPPTTSAWLLSASMGPWTH